MANSGIFLELQALRIAADAETQLTRSAAAAADDDGDADDSGDGDGIDATPPDRRDSSVSSTTSLSDEEDEDYEGEEEEYGIDTFGWNSRGEALDLSSGSAARGGDGGRRFSCASMVSLSEDDIDTMGWGRSSVVPLRPGQSSEHASSIATTSETSSSPPTTKEDGQQEDAPGQPPPPMVALGPGPLRFAPSPYQRSVAAQIDDLFAHERCCFDAVKARWEMNCCSSTKGGGWGASRRKTEPVRSKPRGLMSRRRSSVGSGESAGLTDAQYLHFVRSAHFDEEGAVKMLRAAKRRYLRLTCEEIEMQLWSKTILLPPGLQSREGYDVFYMKASRYFPSQTKTSDVIDNLAYVMQVMLEREHASKEGIAFLANMADWEMTNFSMGYCLQFMKTLQAEHFPVEVRIFLIVDPPAWFDKVWKIMKKMLTPSFQKRVRMIPSSELGAYLGDGYDRYLPDEMEGGASPTDEMVVDFIKYRKQVESIGCT